MLRGPAYPAAAASLMVHPATLPLSAARVHMLLGPPAPARRRQVAAASALSVELWVRPAARVEGDDDMIRPIFALADAAAASTPLSSAGCRDGTYALLIAQQGAVLNVDIRSAVYVRRRGQWVCQQLEVDSMRTSGAVFADPSALYHVAVVVGPGEPLRVYVNGELMPSLYLAANPLAEGTQPLDVQYGMWAPTLHALVAPAHRDSEVTTAQLVWNPACTAHRSAHQNRSMLTAPERAPRTGACPRHLGMHTAPGHAHGTWACTRHLGMYRAPPPCC